MTHDATAEWLQTSGDGGFASGTVGLSRTRRYHALLLAATPAGRFVLVNGIEAWVDGPGGTAAISTQHYAPDTNHPDGAGRISAFSPMPCPQWTFALPDGSSLTQQIFIADGQTVLRWTRIGTGTGPARLSVRLLMSGRDYHALHHENDGFGFVPEAVPGGLVWRSYPGLPPVAAYGGTWRPDPIWYRDFLYTDEQARGLDCTEDLASPGVLTWDLATPATLVLRADTRPAVDSNPRAPDPAMDYVATRTGADTILAGFPWFTDWGRDTFIALRGLLLTRGDVARAGRILLDWARHVDRGMLPNRFPDGGAPPEYNAVDASLWFVVAVHDLLAAGGGVDAAEAEQLQAACAAIVDGYTAGTRFGIRMDTDGLLASGVPGVQLTWMDAKVGDWVVTPRHGKPVEIQALWINALHIVGRTEAADRAQAAFLARFPGGPRGGLRDLVDGDPAEEQRLRPNQIFAVGGLPHSVLPPKEARAVVDLIEARLLTPLGLRTLDPADPDYRGHYAGGPLERDGAYHQGTAWPWLLGPFVEAWLRVHGSSPAAQSEARAEARRRFLPPLKQHLGHCGLGHVSEVVDGDAPHRPGGCPFQAWSLGEMMRIEAMTQA